MNLIIYYSFINIQVQIFKSNFLDKYKNTVIITIMRKLITLILFILCLFAGTLVNAETLPNVQLDMRDYDGIEVPAGTFIPVMNAQEISTQICSEGYKVKFVATNDLFMYDTIVVPKDTEFYGYIEKLNEPVVGTNASMKIKITKMVLTDGFETPIKGYIYTSNNNVIGGGISAPTKYIKMPHYDSRTGKTPTLQLRPGNERKLGSHTVINPGEDEIIILTAPAWITHTLTN